MDIMGIKRSNITQYRVKFEQKEDFTTIVKRGSSTFCDISKGNLPKNMINPIADNIFTSMKYLLPIYYVQQVFELTRAEMADFIENSPIITRSFVLCGTTFLEFAPEFVDAVNGAMWYVLPEDEAIEYIMDGTIDDGIKISEDNYFVWWRPDHYSVKKFSSF